MVAEASQVEPRLNIVQGTPDGSRKGQALGAKARRSKLCEIVQMQDFLMEIVLGECVQYDKKLNLQHVPARERAQCANAWDKLEHRRREALGKASLAPVKTEPRPRGGAQSRSSRVLVESDVPPAPVPGPIPPVV